jgi:hypothetical protein
MLEQKLFEQKLIKEMLVENIRQKKLKMAVNKANNIGTIF